MEVLIRVLVLIGNVFRDDFIRHIARTTTKVTAGPQVTAAESLFQMREFGHQFIRRLPLQALHQTTDRDLRNDRDEQMHMALLHVTFHNRHLHRSADFADQVVQPVCHLTRQNREQLLGDPLQVQMDLVGRMGAPRRYSSSASILQGRLTMLMPSPDRRGFQPSQSGTMIITETV